MRQLLIIVVLISLLAGCKKYHQDVPAPACGAPVELNGAYAKKDSIEKIIGQYIKFGLPGIVVAVYSAEDGYWGMAKGFSKIETKTPMQLCDLQYVQSITKTYLSVAILRLFEEGKIDLDAPITRYLPEKYSAYIDKAATIKVRNLLNHTSGVPEYSQVPAYITFLLQHPDHSFTTEEFLGYIKDKKQRFTPGSRFEYVNTNYHLLALIADAIAGDHAALIRQEVFAPAGLANTFYRGSPGYLQYPNLVNCYLDRFSNGIVENVSMMQEVSVACSKGDDGIIATPVDALNFLRALTEGKLLQPATMKQMLNWVKDESGTPVQGLGLYYVQHAGVMGYGHGGAGIGEGCGLYYFPEKKVTVFLGTNIGTLIDGPIVSRVEELKNKLLNLILQ